MCFVLLFHSYGRAFCIQAVMSFLQMIIIYIHFNCCKDFSVNCIHMIAFIGWTKCWSQHSVFVGFLTAGDAHPSCIDTHCVQPHICLCPCESSHLDLFTYMHISTNLQVSYDGHLCIRNHGAETCEHLELKPLSVHTNTHKYTYFKSKILLRINPWCATSPMSVPL